MVSPSAAGGGSLQWFESFFPICEALGCRIDYLATHDYHGDADLVMERLEMLYQRWMFLLLISGKNGFSFSFGKKIWLTEFAKCCTKDENQVLDFMKVN